MKEHARQFVSERAARDVQARYGLPSDELWVQIRSGRTGDSRNELSAETLRQLIARLETRKSEGPWASRRMTTYVLVVQVFPAGFNLRTREGGLQGVMDSNTWTKNAILGLSWDPLDLFLDTPP